MKEILERIRELADSDRTDSKDPDSCERLTKIWAIANNFLNASLPMPEGAMTGWFAREDRRFFSDSTHPVAVLGLDKAAGMTVTVPLDMIPKEFRRTGQRLLVQVITPWPPDGPTTQESTEE